jgi:hypothetical protein
MSLYCSVCVAILRADPKMIQIRDYVCRCMYCSHANNLRSYVITCICYRREIFVCVNNIQHYWYFEIAYRCYLNLIRNIPPVYHIYFVGWKITKYNSYYRYDKRRTRRIDWVENVVDDWITRLNVFTYFNLRKKSVNFVKQLYFTNLNCLESCSKMFKFQFIVLKH